MPGEATWCLKACQSDSSSSNSNRASPTNTSRVNFSAWLSVTGPSGEGRESSAPFSKGRCVFQSPNDPPIAGPARCPRDSPGGEWAGEALWWVRPSPGTHKAPPGASAADVLCAARPLTARARGRGSVEAAALPPRRAGC